MSEQLYDFFGEIFQRYFRPAIDAYPPMGGALVDRLFTLSDNVPDRLAQSLRTAMEWGRPETTTPRITTELFVITQHGLIYVFFFQAEDGIRYLTVTGVQTCALPILLVSRAGAGAGSSQSSPTDRPMRI